MMTQPNDFQFYFLLLLPRESPDAAQTDLPLPSVAQASSETYTKETLLSIKLVFFFTAEPFQMAAEPY